MMHLVKLEPLEERYTRQWEELFPAACKSLGMVFNQIGGLCIGDSVESGTVLDAHGTNYYKATQLQEIVMGMKTGEIGKGDVLFFYDLWFPGLEMVRYIADMTDAHPMIAGFLHAGTWTQGDFNQRFLPWGRDCERAWMNIADAVFVGSDYHRKTLTDIFPAQTNWGAKVEVTGAPVALEEIDQARPSELKPSTWDVIWPHRWDAAKRPDKLVELASAMPETHFLVTTSRPRISNEPAAVKLYEEVRDAPNIEFRIHISKGEYYRCLWESKVILSTSVEESWGYGVAEGISAQCIPCVPLSASNPEHVYRLCTDRVLAQEMIYPTDVHPAPFDGRMHDLNVDDIRESVRWCLDAADHTDDPVFNWDSYRDYVGASHIRMMETLTGF